MPTTRKLKLNVHLEVFYLLGFYGPQLFGEGQVREIADAFDHLQLFRIKDAVNVGVDDAAHAEIIEDLLDRLVGLAGTGRACKSDDHGQTLVKTEGMRFSVSRIR